jgi:hypothetical protein
MNVDRERLWNHLRILCEEIGPRLSGTPADERTVEYIAGHFRRCGAQVEVQDFPCPGWDHEATELALLGKRGPEPLPAVAQTFTEACDVEAQFVGVGTRHELEYSPDLEGKVLVLYGEAGTGLAPNRNPTVLSVEERRPSAVIVISPDETVSTKLIRDPFLRVPAAAVPQSAGLKLRENEGGRVRLRIRARRYDSTGHNVIGRLPGEEKGRIVVGAHYDTAACSPGAADDAGGTAAVLELCDLLAAEGRRRLGIDFIAFGAEEYGRHLRALGSVEYVRRHPAETRETRAVIQADGVGTSTGARPVHLMGWPARQKEDILRVLRRFPRWTVDEQIVLSSDHAPFYLHGVPALEFTTGGGSVPIHTAQDTIDLMSPEEMAFSAEVMAAVVHHLSSGHGAGVL